MDAPAQPASARIPFARFWTPGRIIVLMLACMVLGLPIYLFLLTTTLFDIKPVPQPALERVAPPGQPFWIEEWCEKDAGYQDWRKWTDDPVIEDLRQSVEWMTDDGLEGPDQKKWLEQAQRVPVLVRRMLDLPQPWDHKKPEGRSLLNWEPPPDPDSQQLEWHLRLLAKLGVKLPEVRPRPKECAALAVDLAIRCRTFDQTSIMRGGSEPENCALQILALAVWTAVQEKDPGGLVELQAVADRLATADRIHLQNAFRGDYWASIEFHSHQRGTLLDPGCRTFWFKEHRSDDWWAYVRLQPNREALALAPRWEQCVRNAALPANARVWPVDETPGWWDRISLAPNAGAPVIRKQTFGVMAIMTRQEDVVDSRRTMGRILVATARYRLDHDGKLPPDLVALVPAYLPAMPLDAVDGKPIRYDARTGMLWSVGLDGVDAPGESDHSSRLPILEELISWKSPTINFTRFFAPLAPPEPPDGRSLRPEPLPGLRKP